MDAKLDAMRKVPVFANLSRSHLQRVASLADEIDLPKGQRMILQGERGREWIVILEGTAEVARDDETIDQVGAGDFVGEIAIVTDTPRTATVTATSDVRVLVVTDRDFRRLLDEEPEIAAEVNRRLEERAERMGLD